MKIKLDSIHVTFLEENLNSVEEAKWLKQDPEDNFLPGDLLLYEDFDVDYWAESRGIDISKGYITVFLSDGSEYFIKKVSEHWCFEEMIWNIEEETGEENLEIKSSTAWINTLRNNTLKDALEGMLMVANLKSSSSQN